MEINSEKLLLINFETYVLFIVQIKWRGCPEICFSEKAPHKKGPGKKTLAKMPPKNCPPKKCPLEKIAPRKKILPKG